MDQFYNKYKNKENEIYKSMDTVTIPTSDKFGINELDEGITWLCEDSKTIFDFGCGNASMLLICALKGVKKCIGIDFSEEAIDQAKKLALEMNCGTYDFRVGSVEDLLDVEDNSIDGVILSNILDNMRPEESHRLMQEVTRILKTKGKILIKLNPLITESQIKECGIQIINDNLLDDGLLLWNQSSEEWEAFLENYVSDKKFVDIYFEQYDQHNRMYLCQTL